MAFSQSPGWDEMGGPGAPIDLNVLETKRECYKYGYWVFANLQEQFKAFQFGFSTAEDAVHAFAKLADPSAEGLLVTWMPGFLDGAQGIGINTVQNHVAAIGNRRLRLEAGFPSLANCPEYGYRGTDPLWFMRKHADTRYISSIRRLNKYTLPTEKEIVEAWGDDWDTLAGNWVYNPPLSPTKFYLAASNRKISHINPERRYGSIEEKIEYGPSDYARPRPRGSQQDDVTSFHPGQWDWDMTNLPPILYQLKADAQDNNPLDWPLPPQLRDADGNPVFDPADPTFPVLDWPFLPFHISTKEDPSQFAAWLRLDPRLKWRDIIARMIVTGRPHINTLNMRLSRFSVAVGIFRWRDSNKSLTKIQSEVQNGTRLPLTAFEVKYNTTRGRTPGWNYSDDENVPVTSVEYIAFSGRLDYLNTVTDSVASLSKPCGPQALILQYYRQREAYDNALRSVAAPMTDYPSGNNIRRGRPRKSKVPRPGEEEEKAADNAQIEITQNNYAQNDYAQNDYAQNDYAQNDYAQNNYAQDAYGQNANGQENGHKRKRANDDNDNATPEQAVKRARSDRPANPAQLIPFDAQIEKWVNDVKAATKDDELTSEQNENENETTNAILTQPMLPFETFSLPDVTPGEDMFGVGWEVTDYSIMEPAAAEALEEQAGENLFSDLVQDEWVNLVNGLNEEEDVIYEPV